MVYFFTVAPDDYVSLNVTLMFDACEIRRCVNVTIMNDFQIEPDENFFYTLEKTPDLDTRIDLSPVDGEIEIFDDDGLFYLLHDFVLDCCYMCACNFLLTGAVVGLEPTFLRVPESVGVVELCAVVLSPVIDCPIAFPFFVSLSTRAGTAGTV